MKLFYSLIIILNFLIASPKNLKSLDPINNLLETKSGYYSKLTQEANQTFYQLYELQLDFKDRYYIEIDDDTKYLRVLISENLTTNDESFHTFEFKNEEILSESEIPENISITIFGRTFNLKEEFYNILKSIFHYTDVTMIKFPKENAEQFDTISKYELQVKNYIGSIDVILEDKDDKVSLEQDLEAFWESVKDSLPSKYVQYTRLAAEFVVVTFGVRRVATNRREKLVQIANKTFYDLYNISLDFKGKNMITFNEKGKYYKVLINEYPKYEGNIFTEIIIKNSRVFFTDFPIFSSLTFQIFGRTFSLKDEFLSIAYLLAPVIKDGVIRIEKMKLDEFDSQLTNKYEIIRDNEESQGGFEVVFEDKDDKREIIKALDAFWKTWSNQIPEQDVKDAKLIAQYVVTTFGIWHNIQNRYEKIVEAAKESLYQLLNTTIDFEGRYIYMERSKLYELAILIDEFPLIPDNVGTYFNISNGRAIFPNITEKPITEKINITGSLFDMDEEYKLFGSIFAAAIRNGKVIIYKKDTETVSNTIRFKCFIKSENNEEYGAFEISLKYIEKSKWEEIKEGIKNFWEATKTVLGEINEGVKLVSEIVGNVNAIKENIVKIVPTHNSSSYLHLNILLIILGNLLILIIL